MVDVSSQASLEADDRPELATGGDVNGDLGIGRFCVLDRVVQVGLDGAKVRLLIEVRGGDRGFVAVCCGDDGLDQGWGDLGDRLDTRV